MRAKEIGRRRDGIRVPVTLFGLLVAGSLARPADGPPAAVALVLDSSGSVGGKDLARARELAGGIQAGLPAGSEVALFAFDDQSRLLLPRTEQADLVRRALATVTVSGKHTALYDALYDASRYLRETPAGRSAIVLITDGRDEDSALNLDDGLKLAVEGRIPVFAIGVGNVEARVLRRIAKLTGGAYIPIALGRPSDIASRIRALEPSSATAASSGSAPGGLAGSVPATLAATARGSKSMSSDGSAAAAGPSGRSAAPTSAGRSGWSPWAYGGLALVATAAALAWLRWGHASGPNCATCGRVLPNALSACAFCSRPTGGRKSAPGLPPGANGATTLAGDVSPTVLTRMSNTEEYLEKTITLKERPVLSVTRGASSGQVFELSREIATSLGRAKANDIVLEDVAISSQHCRIRPENGHFVVHDLKSTNGTFVNERRVTHQPLVEGDVIQIGETYLQFRTEHFRQN